MSSFSEQIWVVPPLNPSKVFSDPPSWVLSYDWSPLFSPQNRVIPPKILPPRAINSDRSLKLTIKTVKNSPRRSNAFSLIPGLLNIPPTRLAILTYSSSLALTNDLIRWKCIPREATLSKQVLSRTCSVRYSVLSVCMYLFFSRTLLCSFFFPFLPPPTLTTFQIINTKMV